MEAHVEGILLVWNFVAFAIMVIFMKYVLWPKITSFILARQQKIEDMMKQYDTRNQEVERLVEKMKEETENASLRRRHLMDETKKEAMKLREEMVQKATYEAGLVLDRAKQDIRRERNEAMEEARREISRLVMRAVKVVLFDVVDEKLDKQIIEETEKAVGILD